MSNTVSRPPLARGLRPAATSFFIAWALLLAILLVLGAASRSTSSASMVRNGRTDVESLAAGVPLGGDASTAADGVLADGASVFDSSPGVANLDLALLRALRSAAVAADEDGVELVVNSGWRSVDYQDQLRREAVAEHGSEAAAARWVAPSNRSAHVSGDAVDIGAAGAAWLGEHGAAYGLCRVYDNEPWHYELRPEAVGGRCPQRYADPTEDPRLQP